MPEEAPESISELVKPGRKLDLRGAFLMRQEQLLATLGVGRGAGGHPVVVGDDSELNWKGMLQSILPYRYQVSKAIVIDADGERSEQIDLLIHDRFFSPVFLEIGEYQFVPAESAYAAFEIKQTIDRTAIRYASGKVTSVRRLRRTSAPVPYVEGAYRPKEPQRILGGLLAMNTGWKVPLGPPLERALGALPGDGTLDILCALRGGSVEVDPHDGTLARSGTDTALMFFVLRLLKRLQQMASVSAIVYDDYAEALAESSRGPAI